MNKIVVRVNMQQIKLYIWNFIKKILCYYTGVRFFAEKFVHPWKKYDRLVDIPTSYIIKVIKEEKIKTIILDMDGTLKHYKKGLLSENKKWVNRLRKYVNIYIVSNANEGYTSEIANELNLPYISKAKKPRYKSFKIVCDNTKSNPNEIIMIGDSIKNDVFGASRAGIKKIILLKDLNIIDKRKR